MLLTTVEIAEKVKLTRARITQLIRDELIVAVKRGRDWMVDDSQIKTILNLPDHRGKYIRAKQTKQKSEEKIAA